MKFRPGITAKLTLFFVFFAAILLAGVGLLAYTSGRSALEAATVSELRSTALEKEAALNRWLEDRRLNIVALASSPDLQAQVSTFMAKPDQANHDRLVQALQIWAGPEQQYLDLLIIEAQTGRVVAATDPNEEGKFRENRPFFINGKKGPYIQNLYYSLSLQQPAMVAAAPLYGTEGSLLGVLAGWLNLEEMTAIMNRRTRLHQTDEAFLINTARLFVTQPRSITDPVVLRRGNQSRAVDDCLQHNSGVISSNDYRGVPAITVYHWLEERQMCLVVKLDQVEALAPVYAFGRTILLIGVLALLGALALAIGLARTITRPVLALQKGVSRFGQGDLEVRLPATTGDELSQLAQEFNLMAAALSEKEAQLRHHAERLEELVRERTAALQTRVRQQAVVAELGQFALLETDIYTLMHKAVMLIAQTLKVEYCKLLELLPEGNILLLRVGVGWRPGVVGQATVGTGPESQAGYTLLSGEPVILADLRTETRFNGSFLLQEYGVISGLSVIILGQGRPYGVLSAHTSRCRTFTSDDANFLQAVANVLAGAIERKEAEDLITQSLQREQTSRAEVEQIRERLAFLAEASKILGSSMDYQTTLVTVARLAVPHIADWCAVDMLAEDGGLNRVGVAHVDPSKVEYAYELQRRFPFDPEAPTGTAKVLRTGQSEFYPEINEAVLAASGADEEVLEIVRQLGLRSAITAPLRTFERVLGVITLVWAESNQYYTPADVDLAEELARRAGVAVENARLFRETQQLNLQLEKRVKERTASLEAANKELEAFSYTVSHDLRSPLRAIDGFSRVLLEQYNPQLAPDAQRYLGMVRHGAQQMGQLIDDLLTFARLSRLPLRRQTVAPGELIHQVLEELRVEREGRQIEFILNDLPLCQADPTLLRQVWFNLLANALKYSRRREAAKIEIGYDQAGEAPAYFVKDNGVGFDMQYADKLFGVFQRLHLAEEYEGTGVGLAIVQRIVHRHGGRVWAEAALDKGATFYFTLNEGNHHE